MDHFDHIELKDKLTHTDSKLGDLDDEAMKWKEKQKYMVMELYHLS